MSVNLKLAGHPLLLYHRQLGFHEFSCVSIRFPGDIGYKNRKTPRFVCSVSQDPESARLAAMIPRMVYRMHRTVKVPRERMKLVEEDHSHRSSTYYLPSYILRILERLKGYGISGILSYGLLNTAYYLTTFLIVWFRITPAPGRMGYLAAVERFLKIMAMVWVGSQVTKLIRAAGALALAPFVDRGLSWFTDKFKFESQGKAFMVIVGFCFGLVIMLFLGVTVLWA